jgi:hypothetical protein
MYAPHCASDEMYEGDCVKQCNCSPCPEECECGCKLSDDCSCECEESDYWDDENSTIVRGKWMFDGCKSIAEMVEALKKQITFLEGMKADGWEVREEIDDDYAFLHRTPQEKET